MDRELFAQRRITGIGHVAEREGAVGACRDRFERLFDLRRRRQVGIAEAEVVHLVGAVFFAQFDPGLEHPADHGRIRDVSFDFIGNQLHDDCSPVSMAFHKI